MAVIQEVRVRYYNGLSTDTKPTLATNEVTAGSEFWEHDTNIRYKTYDGTTWVPLTINSIILPGTFNLQQAANTYDLSTATGGTVYVERFVFTLPAVNVSDDVNITSISVQSDMPTVNVLISAAQGAKTNLTASKSFTYSTPFALTVGKKIQLTIAGGASDASTLCTFSIRYQAVTPAAYLV